MGVTDEPIVVVAGGNLLFFSSRVGAEQYLEAIDVEEGEYSWAFDADGHPLRLGVVQTVEKGLFGFGQMRVSHVRIERDIAGLGVRDAREVLVAFLRRVDPDTSIDPATPISDIVRAAAAKYAVY